MLNISAIFEAVNIISSRYNISAIYEQKQSHSVVLIFTVFKWVVWIKSNRPFKSAKLVDVSLRVSNNICPKKYVYKIMCNYARHLVRLHFVLVFILFNSHRSDLVLVSYFGPIRIEITVMKITAYTKWKISLIITSRDKHVKHNIYYFFVCNQQLFE